MSEESAGRILVVDDESDALLFLYDYLTGQGYRVEGSSRAADALEGIGRRPPAVLIADVRMPEMDGLELSERCRAKSPGTRIILLSSSVDGELERRARQAGAEALLGKPVQGAALLRALGRILGPAHVSGSASA